MRGHGAIAAVRAARHLHAPLQHRADRGDAGVLPGRTSPSTAVRPVDATVVGLFAAMFYLAELVLSPIFGILSDRLGHHRVMLYGPIFGGDRGDPDRADRRNLLRARRRRASSRAPRRAASVPSILGFIALATAGNELLRGKAAARFEGATLAGLGRRVHRRRRSCSRSSDRPRSSSTRSSTASRSSSTGRGQGPGRRGGGGRRRARPGSAATSSSSGRRTCWLLAPTWIAVNAAIGLWFSQSLFQFAKANPRFPDQALMRGFAANQITVGAIVIAVIFGAGLLYWGNRFKTMRRTTIICYGDPRRGRARGRGPRRQPPVGDRADRGGRRGALRRRRPVRARRARRRRRSGLLADISERFPADRGAIMGLYSVFLAIGQITGALIGGVAADWRGHRRHAHRHAHPARHRPRPARAAAQRRSTRSSMPEPDGRSERAPA